MSQSMTYSQARDFEAAQLADDVFVTGIRSPDYGYSNYDVDEPGQWRQFFRDCRDSGGGPIAIEVQVQDAKGGAAVGDESGWLSPDDAVAFIAKHRGGGQ